MTNATHPTPTDLTYRKDGLWIWFMPYTPGAEKVWAQIVPPAPFDRNADGSLAVGCCFAGHLDAQLKALRKAGWTVRAKLLASEQAELDAIEISDAEMAEFRAIYAA